MKKKLILDIIMTITLLLLMRIKFLNINIHELVGVLTFIFFIIHKIFNYNVIKQTLLKWNKLLFKNRIGFIIDILILFVFILLLISSIIISKNIFNFLNISSTYNWSNLHHFFAYLLLILISIHLGIHYNNIWIIIKNKFKIKDNKFLKYSYIVISILIISFGIRVIFNNSFYKYLLKPFGYKENYIDNNVESKNTITLEEYIKDKHCDGCSRHCPLTNLRCPTGQIYLEKAKEEYNKKYLISTKENTLIVVELNVFDYILVMSSIVASTHYIFKAKKIK